jgi:anthranilate phosphoribosyltransferase
MVLIKEAIGKLMNKEDLSEDMVAAVMDEIMSGEASDVTKAAYLVALHMKGETVEEITASALGMRKYASKINHKGDVLEIVGTGGDKSNSFNISTTSSLVLAAAGIPVAKHGNRAASSKCGAADVLEALGVNIMLEPEKMEQVLNEIGICFMHAQVYHSAMKYVGPIRKELGVPTVFNILGPLTNPANANIQVMGVYSEELVEPMAHVLAKLGVDRAMVVYGQDCLDEISMSAPTTVCEHRNGEFKKFVIEPEQFGMAKCKKEELVGGTPQENAAITRAVLSGEKGPKRDAVVLNTAAGIYITKDGVSMEEAVKIAQETIDSGKALAKLEEFVKATNR